MRIKKPLHFAATSFYRICYIIAWLIVAATLEYVNSNNKKWTNIK